MASEYLTVMFATGLVPEIQESRSAARKLRDAAAILFGLG